MSARQRHGRGGLLLAAATALLVAGAWLLRASWLGAAGALLVAEDPIDHVDAVFLAYAAERGGALEAVRLFGEGRLERVAAARWPAPPVDDAIRALGVAVPRPTELARAILEQGGVPGERVEILPVEVDGTGAEIPLIAGYMRDRGLGSVCYLTARSHTARSRWLLARALPPGTRLVVRSPRDDPFASDGWWKRRAVAREVAMEYLRWANALLLGDAWATPEPSR